MYSGLTFTPLSGRLVGAHQKIDRLARGSLRPLLKSKAKFPSSKLILHFEGSNGPDAIKRKSPAKDEPWHYYSPFDPSDTKLTEIIEGHYDMLVAALKKDDQVRAAFEASWLAHAVVDGLTPAHHFPYEEKLIELRGGEGLETRTTWSEKIVMPGKTTTQQLKNNWRMWGVGGLFTTHIGFEWGVAAIILPFRQKQVVLKQRDVQELVEHGVMGLFKRKAKEIDGLGIYDAYRRYGWTPKLAWRVRRRLLPSIVQMVTLAWYGAAIDAGLAKHPVSSKKVESP